MAPYETNLLDQTISVWQPYYVETLTREDARQILDNTLACFRKLLDWSMAPPMEKHRRNKEVAI
jgi:hypothetical protein